MQEPHSPGGNRDSTLGVRTQGIVCNRTQGKRSNSIGAWARPTCWSWRVSWSGRGWGRVAAAHPGDIDTGGRHIGEYCWWMTYWLISSKTCPHPTACRQPCWDASGQRTNWVRTQLHPLADRLPKDKKAHSCLWTSP